MKQIMNITRNTYSLQAIHTDRNELQHGLPSDIKMSHSVYKRPFQSQYANKTLFLSYYSRVSSVYGRLKDTGI